MSRTEYYGIGAYPAESCTLAFPWIFTVNNNARWGNQEGPEEIQLAVSRDLIHWDRPFRTPIIEIGQLDQWDASYHTTAAIGLVTWPLDRFVSADAGSDGGVLTTIPVRHRGDRLEINTATKPDGQLVVELLDAGGRPLEGFPPSEPFTGDDLRHVVRFNGQTDVSTLRGKPITLRFRMKNAELYSFAFRGEERPVSLRKTPEKLRTSQPVKIVCLGDSVTGIYYHTGGRRAYPKMIALALKTAYPQAEVTVINAGISGNTTVDTLNRLQKDVLDHKPDLVTVKFGLNDMVRVLAMPPYDELIGLALRAVVPSAQVEVSTWPTAQQSLAQIKEAAKSVRKSPPDLVLLAVPAAVTPNVRAPPEEAIRAHSWILNWSLAFGLRERDVVGIAPSVLKTSVTPEEKGSDEFSRRMVLAQDLSLIARPENDESPPEHIFENWLRTQLAGK